LKQDKSPKRGAKSSFNMPTVSIVVLNWNGKHFLKNCLNSLQKLTYKKVEIIVVDNNSSDGSQTFVKENYPKVKLISNKKNYGFAEGNNIGYKVSKGEYVMFLNNDTQVSSNFLEPLITDFTQDQNIGCIQPKMRIMKEKNLIDVVGSFMTFTGFLYHYGYRKNQALQQYNRKMKIFSAKGACIILPRKVLEKVGVFDSDFFIFFEETDLCYRVWLAGYSVMYEPKSIIFHVTGGDTIASDKYKYERRIYLICKNTTYSYLKNFGTYNFITIFPIFMLVQIGLFLKFALTGKFYLSWSILKAYWWNINHVNSTIEKRKLIQKTIRKVSDIELKKHIYFNPRISYYILSFFQSTTQKYKE